MFNVAYAARSLGIAVSLFLATAAAAPTLADQEIQTPQAPVVVVRSTSGLVSVVRGDAGVVRVLGSSATATTFQMRSDNQGMMLPRGMGLPARRFTLPGVREGTMGVRVENSGGDITIAVPQRVAAVLVRLDDGDAVLSDFRGPYVVVANGGSIDLRSLAGFRHVRTSSGRVTMTRLGGNLHVETAKGGDIDWNFARVGGGPFRFTSGAGNVRVALNGEQAANIDAQSTQGSVINRFSRTAAVRFRSPHAMSMSLRGGGPEITAASRSGIVEVGPRPKP